MMLDFSYGSTSWHSDSQVSSAGIGNSKTLRTPEVRTLAKQEICTALPSLRQLRATIFRDWPYLYDADQEFESAYLQAIATADNAALVVALDRHTIVGAASVSPLASQESDIVNPLAAIGWDIESTVYFGESLLLADYRGQGVGHRFFDARETYAREAGASGAVFASVVRLGFHPLRPSNYRPLHEFWRRRGYAPIDGATCTLPWKETGDAMERPHTLQFWYRNWTGIE